MNLLDKFDAVTVKADVRIAPEDKAFCEAHQAAYDAAIQSFQELAFFWEDMENTQQELLGSSDTSYLSSRDGPEISQRQINKHLEHLHQSVIYNLVHYFNSTYHVTVSADHVANNLLPQKPDLRIYENKEAHDAYHEKLRAAKVRYEDVVDQIILLLDGRSFAEQAFHELTEKCHKAAWNLYHNKMNYERKKALISFNGYFCAIYHYSWQDEWTLEDNAKIILRGVAHYETDSFNLYPLGFSELLGYNRSCSNEHEFSTCKKVKGLKMFKNGRVDIRFTTETNAAEFAARYLGLVPYSMIEKVNQNTAENKDNASVILVRWDGSRRA